MFIVKEVYSDPSGFYGAIFQDTVTNELVVAFRGTELPDDTVRDAIETDEQMFVDGVNQQLDGARRLMEKAIELSATGGIEGGAPNPVQLSVTGHSLGGSLAQVMSYDYNLYGETFNAYGATGVGDVPRGATVPEGQNTIVNHIRATDIVGLANTQYGEVREYATTDDLRFTLASADSGLAQVLDTIFEAANLLPGATHSIDYFVGDNSVLTQENEKRYEDYQNAFDLYRDRLQVGAGALKSLLIPTLANAGLLESYLANKTINLFIGSTTEDASNKADPAYMRGTLNADTLTGGSDADLIFGDDGADVLYGNGGNDSLYGGSQDDYLDGGAGSDLLEGGDGHDRYNFSIDDLAAVPGSLDVVSDSDGDGQIEIDNNVFSVGQRLSATTWSSLDGKFILSADLSEAAQTLTTRNKASGSTILIKDWSNGALGIELGGDITTPSTTPLTGDDDLFGHGGNNSGDDKLTALAGNDGLSAGAGSDYLDAGDGNDLMFGGSGNDTLLGGLGADIIIDDSEFADMQDWSDDVGADGKSQRQREEDNIQQLGAAVIAQGKGWYVYTSADGADTVYNIVTADGSQVLDPAASPSGDDRIDGGDGDDVIWSGEGNDTVHGGADADYLDGGADDDVIYGGDGADKIWGDTPARQVTEGSAPSVVSAAAQKNGNDILYGGAGNDTVDGGGGNDLIDGGDGADLLLGNGNPEAVDPDDPDIDVIDGGIGNDTIFGDDGNDTVHGGADDDLISGDDANANTRDGNDRLYGDAGNDTITGDGGDDTIYGGIGDDSIMGDSNLIDGSRHGDDILYGEDGNDSMAGGGGDDILLGGDGNDLMHGDNDESVLDV
ncbi:MAG: hypothetical protein KGL56_13520, partial [Alphaproteobacteria bacterium]|nr:hypothetical protein [Alphaproteobacteria bacterium]